MAIGAPLPAPSGRGTLLQPANGERERAETHSSPPPPPPPPPPPALPYMGAELAEEVIGLWRRGDPAWAHSVLAAHMLIGCFSARLGANGSSVIIAAGAKFIIYIRARLRCVCVCVCVCVGMASSLVLAAGAWGTF